MTFSIDIGANSEERKGGGVDCNKPGLSLNRGQRAITLKKQQAHAHTTHVTASRSAMSSFSSVLNSPLRLSLSSVFFVSLSTCPFSLRFYLHLDACAEKCFLTPQIPPRSPSLLPFESAFGVAFRFCPNRHRRRSFPYRLPPLLSLLSSSPSLSPPPSPPLHLLPLPSPCNSNTIKAIYMPAAGNRGYDTIEHLQKGVQDVISSNNCGQAGCTTLNR